MKVVLAEKPSVARDIAAVLGARQKHDGYLEGEGYQVTWAYGHLVTLQTPDDYDPALKQWKLEGLPFIPARFQLKLVSEAHSRKQFPIIKRLFKDADEIICATDAGREGELIFRYILTLAGSRCKRIQRLWLQSLTPQAIRTAFRDLRPASNYDSLYEAARCRSEADWIVGLNATRNFTVRYRDSGTLWSVGRVQTPVLAMIVQRDDEIRIFKPEPFWELRTRYRETLFRCELARSKAEPEALALLDRVQGQPFEVTAVDKQPRTERPPLLYDLTSLQRDMNRRYGYSAADTLKAAQSLYEKKALTYPRTDSCYLTDDMRGKIPGILGDLRASHGEAIAQLDLEHLPFSGRIINNQKVSDHHAIIPTGKSVALSGIEGKVYDAVVTRLIAVFYPPCRKEITTVKGQSNRVPFQARGTRVLEPGWTQLYPPPKKRTDAEDDEHGEGQELPEFRKGESGPHHPLVHRGETKPPSPYTENSLLALMETAGKLVDDDELKDALKERGIGTPATRAAIIETLLTRGYIERLGKSLRATDPGRYLIAIIQDRALKSPELTGEWEARLTRIQRGELDPASFMADIATYAHDLIRTSGKAPVVPGQLGACPRCGAPVIKGRKGYGCSAWRDGCTFVIWPSYEGVELREAQLLALLQHQVLLEPVIVGGQSSLLYITHHGVLTHVAMPARQASPVGRGGRGKRQGKSSGGRRQTGQAGKPAGGASRPAGESPGPCPLCGKPVTEQTKSFSCSAWKEGCTFTIWKKIAEKKISLPTARTLLEKGKTSQLKGFKSRTGNPFNAALILRDGKVEMLFDDQQKRSE